MSPDEVDDGLPGIPVLAEADVVEGSVTGDRHVGVITFLSRLMLHSLEHVGIHGCRAGGRVGHASALALYDVRVLQDALPRIALRHQSWKIKTMFTV